jgi:hypothetical protein
MVHSSRGEERSTLSFPKPWCKRRRTKPKFEMKLWVGQASRVKAICPVGGVCTPDDRAVKGEGHVCGSGRTVRRRHPPKCLVRLRRRA